MLRSVQDAGGHHIVKPSTSCPSTTPYQGQNLGHHLGHYRPQNKQGWLKIDFGRENAGLFPLLFKTDALLHLLKLYAFYYRMECWRHSLTEVAETQLSSRLDIRIRQYVSRYHRFYFEALFPSIHSAIFLFDSQSNASSRAATPKDPSVGCSSPNSWMMAAP